MWGLNDNGTLVNTYSGLCATTNLEKGDQSSCLLLCLYTHMTSEITDRFLMQLIPSLVEPDLGLRREEEVRGTS